MLFHCLMLAEGELRSVRTMTRHLPFGFGSASTLVLGERHDSGAADFSPGMTLYFNRLP